MQGLRVPPASSFRERLAREAEQAKAEAEKLPDCIERDLLLKKARQAETAMHINEWLASPGLRPPR